MLFLNEYKIGLFLIFSSWIFQRNLQKYLRKYIISYVEIESWTREKLRSFRKLFVFKSALLPAIEKEILCSQYAFRHYGIS